MKPKEEKNTAARITNQFHLGDKMVYEFRCDGVSVSISMMGGKDRSEWHAEATAKVFPDAAVAQGVGASRGDALSGLREAWCCQREGRPFPRLDWEAIRLALATVRAI
jgi:hypothetical protein